MNDFDRHFNSMRRYMVLAIIAKLAVVAGLIGLAIYAINAFTG